MIPLLENEMNLLQRIMARIIRPAPTAPRYIEPPWQAGYDGMAYVNSRWDMIDRQTVEWRGDSRPVSAEGIANPNHVEAYKELTVPAGALSLSFSADVVITSDNPLAGMEPVTAGLRIWQLGQNSLIDSRSCYRSPVTENKTIRAELQTSMPVIPGKKVRLYLTGYSAAGGLIRFGRLAYAFTNAG